MTNISEKPVEVALAGWLENFALPGERIICKPGGPFGGFTCDCIKLPHAFAAVRRNRVIQENGLTSILMEVQDSPPARESAWCAIHPVRQLRKGFEGAGLALNQSPEGKASQIGKFFLPTIRVTIARKMNKASTDRNHPNASMPCAARRSPGKSPSRAGRPLSNTNRRRSPG